MTGSKVILVALWVLMLSLPASIPVNGPDTSSDGIRPATSEGPGAGEATRGDRSLPASDPPPRIPDLAYVAVGPSMFENELQPLLDWKTQKGVKAVFFPTDSHDDSPVFEFFPATVFILESRREGPHKTHRIHNLRFNMEGDKRV